MKKMKILPSLLLAILLGACQSGWIPELLTQPGQPLFQDDFSEPASGWPRTSSADGSMEFTDGSYQIRVESPGYDLRAVYNQVFRDVQVEADTSHLAGPINNRLGLICRLQDLENYYDFIISSDGYYTIGKIKDGIASLLGQEMMNYSAYIVQGDGLNHLRFDCIGNRLQGYVNGQLIAVSEDEDFPNGKVGLLAGAFEEAGVEIRFDNFMVLKP
jgi:hypothetical protein